MSEEFVEVGRMKQSSCSLRKLLSGFPGGSVVKMPHAAEQRSSSSTTIELMLSNPGSSRRGAAPVRSPSSTAREQRLLALTGESLHCHADPAKPKIKINKQRYF